MTLNSAKNSKGFTLVELMIVVAIIGILVAIAIPNFMNYQAKSQQAEAKVNLGAIFKHMMSYVDLQDQSGFTNANLSKIGFSISGTARYTYALENLSTTTFRAKATGTSGRVINDVWTIDQGKNLIDVDPSSFNN